MTGTTSGTGRFGDTTERASRLERFSADLAGAFKGAVITGSDDAYEAERQVWNAMVDKHPHAILKCTDTEDVATAVRLARKHGYYPSVRGGGHSVSGRALTDDGITIDLGGLRQVVVEPDKMLVHIGGGCRLGDVDASTAPHGLVVPAGIMSETGVGGLALGGGIGWLSRKFGLTCDHFVELELVLSNGSVVNVTEASDPELFWALRGGGGNFGIVTRFTVRARQFGPMVRVGLALYDPGDATGALREYAEIVPTLSRSVGWHAVLKSEVVPAPFVPDELVGRRMLMMLAMWLDDAEDEEGIAEIDRLCAVGNPRHVAKLVLPFADAMQKAVDVEFGDGHRYYTKESHLTDLTGEVIDRVVGFWTNMPMDGAVEIISLGGAIADVAEADSAFSNRHYALWLNFNMRWDDASKDEEYIALTRSAVASLQQWIGSGVYLNMLNFDELDRVVEALGGPEKFARLQRVKERYDPDNFFRVNYNVAPAAAAG